MDVQTNFLKSGEEHVRSISCYNFDFNHFVIWYCINIQSKTERTFTTVVHKSISQPIYEICDGFLTEKISLLADAFVHTCRERTFSFQPIVDAIPNYKMIEIEVVTGNNSDMFFSRFQEICLVV